MSRLILVAVGVLFLSPLSGPAQTMSSDERIPPPPPALNDRLQDIDRHIAYHPADLGVRIQRIDVLYLMGVDDEACVERGLLSLDDLEARFGEQLAHENLDSRVRALRGALITLRAKHAFWPHHKLGHVNEGMAILDDAVADQPESAPIRYLRLMSGFYLPGILGRADEVETDLHALARLLPHARNEFPPDLYPVIVEFVLEHGRLTGDERFALTQQRSVR